MNYVLKSMLITLALTLVLTSTYSQKNIELRIDKATGKLVLYPSETAKRGRFFSRRVSWEIKDTSIESFEIVPKPDLKNRKPYNPDPFKLTGKPHINTGNSLDLKIRFLVHRGYWKYSIIWIDKVTHRKDILDPIISIKPQDTY